MNEARAIRERLKGAVQYLHPRRGVVWMLKDGSIISKAEYMSLVRQSWTLYLTKS